MPCCMRMRFCERDVVSGKVHTWHFLGESRCSRACSALVGLCEQAQRGGELERTTVSQVSFDASCQPQKDFEEMSCVLSQGCPC